AARGARARHLSGRSLAVDHLGGPDDLPADPDHEPAGHARHRRGAPRPDPHARARRRGQRRHGVAHLAVETFRMTGGAPEIRLFAPENVWTVLSDGRLVTAKNSAYSFEVRDAS